MNSENLDPTTFIHLSYGLAAIAISGFALWLFWDRLQLLRIQAVLLKTDYQPRKDS